MKRILIIEDDKLIANIYRQKFVQEGWLVDIASDGAMGIEMVNSKKPDVVVLDLVLPKVLGHLVLQHIRSQPDMKTLPVIVFSEGSHPTMVDEALKAGATRMASKIRHGPPHIVQMVKTALAETEKSAATAAPAAVVSKPHEADRYVGADFQTELRGKCLEAATAALDELQRLHQAFVSQGGGDAVVQEMARKTHALGGYAGLSRLHHCFRMAAALEGYLQELHFKPEAISAVAVTTVEKAIEFLGALFRASANADNEREAAFSACVLALSDDRPSRQALRQAIAKIHLTAISTDDERTALRLVEENLFDLVILDLTRPGTNNFDLCVKLRATPNYTEVPILVLTASPSLEKQAQTDLSGGNALMGKPFLQMELAVRALQFILYRQMGGPATSA